MKTKAGAKLPLRAKKQMVIGTMMPSGVQKEYETLEQNPEK